jgi:murein DD-endopeptidase MepM/ murein hydrolase activator NlpD
MKKITQPIRIIVLTLMILFTINGFGIFSGQVNSTSNYSSNKQMLLQFENKKLKENLLILKNRLDTIEKNFNKVQEYDNMIYSQILGYNIDSNNLYRFDNINYLSEKYCLITTKLDVKTMRISKMVDSQLKKLKNEYNVAQANKNIINYYPTISPIKISDIEKIASGFGWRKHPVYHIPLFHDGIDIVAKKGINVYSSASGNAVKVKYSRFRYGNHILINHRNGYETLYAHLSQIFIIEGQNIVKGQLIGTVGSSGLSTGPHLHYEVHFNKKKKNPLNYLYAYMVNDIIVEK